MLNCCITVINIYIYIMPLITNQIIINLLLRSYHYQEFLLLKIMSYILFPLGMYIYIHIWILFLRGCSKKRKNYWVGQNPISRSYLSCLRLSCLCFLRCDGDETPSHCHHQYTPHTQSVDRQISHLKRSFLCLTQTVTL